MEDPWVSPWATTTNNSADSPAKLDLPTPPPHAHFSTGGGSDAHPSSRHTSPGRKSPLRTHWDEEDAWGGWNDAASGGGGNSPGWGRMKNSPTLRPLEGRGSISRLPSPDPWARDPGVANPSDEQIFDSGFKLGERRRSSTNRGRGGGRGRLEDVIGEDIWGPSKVTTTVLHMPKPIIGDEIELPESPMSPMNQAAEEEENEEEERRLGMDRQPSKKVQQLVNMFDGMTKKNVSNADTSRPTSKRSFVGGSIQEWDEEGVLEETGEEEASESGTKQEDSSVLKEEKDGLKVEDEQPLEDEKEPDVDVDSGFKEKPSIIQETDAVQSGTEQQNPDEALGKPDEPADEKEDESVLESGQPLKPVTEFTLPSTTSETKASEVATHTPSPPTVPYTIDLSKLDDMFPSVDASFPSPEPVPDVIIDDTFASIGERKMWYRISRFGSVRKHDLGDDEGYVRIGWAKSKVREQSIHTVRRWMEEDSIGGRAVPGRRLGVSGRGVFNWNSSGPAVEISELLAQRKNNSRQATPTASTFGWGESTAMSPTSAMPPTKIPEPTNAKTTSSRSPASAVSPFPPPSRPASIAISRPASISRLSPSLNQVIAPPASPLGQPPQTAESDKSDEGEEDDDDWGEMVTSPAAQTNGTFPAITPPIATEGQTESTKPTNLVLPTAIEQNEDDDDDWGEMVSSPSLQTNGVFPPVAGPLKKSPLGIASPVSSSSSVAQDNGWSSGQFASTSDDRVVSLALSGNTNTAISSPATSLPMAVHQDGLETSTASPTIDSSVFPSGATNLEHQSQPSITSVGGLPPLTPSQGVFPPFASKQAPATVTPVTNTARHSWGFEGLDMMFGDIKSPPSRSASALSQTPLTPTSNIPPQPIESDRQITKAMSPASIHSPSFITSPTSINQSISSPLTDNQTVNDEDDDDKIVATILRDLPDLTYMLR